MKRILTTALVMLLAAGADAFAQRATVIAGGDIEWSRSVKAPDIFFDRPELKDRDKEWPRVPYLNTPEHVAHLQSMGVKVDPNRGHHATAIRYGLSFASKEEEVRYPFQKVAPVLRSADIAFANLENPLSDRARHTGAFRAPTQLADALRWAGIDVVSIANNHAFDAEEQGLFDTIDALSRAGVGRVGGGRDLEDARRPFIIERNGIRFAFLGYTQFVNVGPSAFALPDRSGVVPLNPLLIEEDIRRVRDQVDYVVVSFHWSRENTQEIHEEDRTFAHGVVDAGADIVLGHHPHVPRGVEVYRGGVIFYSFGNLVFGHGHDYWMDNFLARITLDRERIDQVEILPVAGTGSRLAQPYLLTGDEAKPVLSDLQRRSAELGTRMDIRGDVGVISVKAARRTATASP